WAVAWFRLGTYRFEQRDFEGAEAAFAKALECDPGHARSWNNLSLVRLAQGRLEEAEEAAKRALAIQPDYAFAFVNLAKVAAARGREDERKALEAVARGLAAVDAALAPARPGAG
ncbi:MAG TPA: tetratricopeptide repeat protein, partial [Usitatibacter sp.]|nr:tetratricopeptide repeat protein [Usitatibacter sp.]